MYRTYVLIGACVGNHARINILPQRCSLNPKKVNDRINLLKFYCHFAILAGKFLLLMNFLSKRRLLCFSSVALLFIVYKTGQSNGCNYIYKACLKWVVNSAVMMLTLGQINGKSTHSSPTLSNVL